MNYELEFLPSALKAWKKLSPVIRDTLKKKLKERCQQPHITSAKLHSLPNAYKIKLKTSGFRLVYQIKDKKMVVLVVAVGRRERNKVYKEAAKRIT